MKILAIEKELKEVDWSMEHKALENEARFAYKLYLDGYIREIYFNENHNAVIILECEDMRTATELLDSLPLVIKGLITFEIMQLKPYTGFDRIMQ